MRVKPCLTRGELYCYAAGLKRFQNIKKIQKKTNGGVGESILVFLI